MNNKFWLRLAMLAMAAVMLVTVMAGCGEEPELSDPDTSDYSDVTDAPNAPTEENGDNDTTTTAGDDTTTEGDASTTTGDGSTTTGDGSTPTSDKNTTTDGKNSTTNGTATAAPSGNRPGIITRPIGGSKTSATATGGGNTTAAPTGSTTNQLGDEDPGDTNDVIDRNKFKEQNKNVAMPTRKLANNVVTVFSWRDQQSDNCYGGSKPDLRKVYKDVGLETKWYQATHDNYMDALAAVVASGSAPDLVEWNAIKMYPAAIASGLVVPYGNYIDFSSKIWDDVRSLTAKYQINGGTYFSVEYMQIAELLYYDPTIIKAAGLKTPLELWRENKWTLKELQNIADKTVKIDKEGKVTRYGFVPGDIGAITGLEMVEYNRARGYKLNITNSKYKTLMNIMYQMGVNGTRSAGFTTPGDVGKGNVVMSMTAGWGMTNEMNDARLKGQLEWCVLPKLDNNSEHYYNLTLQQTFGLIKGAQNPEGGAYMIELRKWAFLNYPWLETLPFTDTAYTRKYGEKLASIGSGDKGTLTKEQIAYSTELLSKDYDVVANNLWGGWVGNGQFPGITEVVSNGNSWSTVLANKKATMEAVLKQWKF
ncbi:MAG: hypothetical protein IJO76_00785 [Clostridia bacterium]|nr:hypothetical protein [Clostridia bacterium]